MTSLLQNRLGSSCTQSSWQAISSQLRFRSQFHSTPSDWLASPEPAVSSSPPPPPFLPPLSSSSSSSSPSVPFSSSSIFSKSTSTSSPSSTPPPSPLSFASHRRTSSRLPVHSTSSRFRSDTFPLPSFPPSFGANQIVPIPSAVKQRLDRVVSEFDAAPIRFAIAYGSGVFSQSSTNQSQGPKKMIDFIFAVTHPSHWHSLNMAKHPSHYSFLARTLSNVMGMSWIQRTGAGLWYNPYVTVGDESVKYGVISVDDLCNDLLDWDTLYVSGRMHKPVALVTSDARVRLAQQVNLASALRVALLLLPRSFTEIELYTQIASISYTGDFRMSLPGGENSNKITNIVENQLVEFQKLYFSLIRNFGTIAVDQSNPTQLSFTQDTSIETRASYAQKLPRSLRKKIQHHYIQRAKLDPAFLTVSKDTRNQAGGMQRIEKQEELERFWKAAVQRTEFNHVLKKMIVETVQGPAWSQSLKGIYTAGPVRTCRYVFAKIGNYFQGKQQNHSKQG